MTKSTAQKQIKANSMRSSKQNERAMLINEGAFLHEYIQNCNWPGYP
jgi:hypothetical protein